MYIKYNIYLNFQAYMFQYHPDKNPSDPKMHDKFVILNAAYSVLSKSSSKQEYDITLGYQRRTVHHTQNASPFYTHQPKNTAHSKPHSWNSYQAEYDQQYVFNCITSIYLFFLWTRYSFVRTVME